jgi:hypothetical protein
MGFLSCPMCGFGDVLLRKNDLTVVAACVYPGAEANGPWPIAAG